MTKTGDKPKVFQSTRPLGGATSAWGVWSISSMSFNPRAPWGARRITGLFLIGPGRFQSTRPLGGATAKLIDLGLTFRKFQSTRPLGGATPDATGDQQGSQRFNPRAPWGARHVNIDDIPTTYLFQSTRPLGGAT